MSNQVKSEINVSGTKFAPETKIKFAANPKRPGSNAHERYEVYQKARTFGEYLKLNEGKFALPDARHDFSHKFLTIA